MDPGRVTSVDLLEEIRATLDGLDALLVGRVVDIEMSRLRVLADPTLFRHVLAELLRFALAHSQPTDPITVHVARTGKTARIEIRDEDGHAARGEFPDLAVVIQHVRTMGGEIGTAGPGDVVISWMTLPLATGSSSAADA